MKTKLAITALALTLSVPVMADDSPQDDLTFCEEVAVGAEAGMIMRQAEMPFAEVYLSNKPFQHINTLAYDWPLVSPLAADFVAKAFGQQMQLRCEMEGMRWTNGGTLVFKQGY